MSLVSFFKRIFSDKEISSNEETINVPEENELIELQNEVEKIQIFKSENVIFNKLAYLEQYIKIFSLTFPEDYNGYLKIIEALKRDYAKELEEFQKGKEGSITFSIDPEHESKRYLDVIALEDDIKNFVEFEVDYKFCLDKFSKLCYKLNVFYNAIIDTTIQREKIISQVNNAYNSLEMLVKDLNQREFFQRDSRKKDDILDYIIYCDYIIFKTFLRMGIIGDFAEYKQEISKIYSFFVDEQYDNLIFKFFIESLEEIQILINTNLKLDPMFQYVLKESQNLERKLDDFNEIFNDYTFFQNILKFENTVYSLINTHKLKFTFDISKMVNFEESKKEIISINDIAKSILTLVGNQKAKLLERVVSGFVTQISWREFYFLCKIFELNEDIIKTSENTVFSMVKEKFLKLEEKYQEYTNDYILEEKRKILNYSGDKAKKYVMMFKISQSELVDIVELLKTLSLEFVIRDYTIYLNHSYFNGFKNLEENFGQEITF